VVIWHRAFQDSSGNDPAIAIRLTIKQGGNHVLRAENKYNTKWYSDMMRTNPVTGLMQYYWRVLGLFTCPLILRGLRN